MLLLQTLFYIAIQCFLSQSDTIGDWRHKTMHGLWLKQYTALITTSWPLEWFGTHMGHEGTQQEHPAYHHT